MDFNIKVVDSIDSTNSFMKRSNSRKNGDVLIAYEQTGGRGRLGRSFESPRGGLYMSVFLDALYPVEEMPFVTVLCGIAVLNVIGTGAKIKWPNDIFINDKKVCGILTELVGERESYGVIIGIGLNLNSTHSLPPCAASLKMITGRDYDILETARSVLKNIDILYARMNKELLAEKLLVNLYEPSDEMDMWLRRFGIRR